MGQVQDAGADLRRSPIRSDIREAHDRGRDRRRDREVEHHLRLAEKGDRGVEGIARVGRAEGVVGAEVTGEAVGHPAGAPRQCGAGPPGRLMGVRVDARGDLGARIDQLPREWRRAAVEPPLARHRRRMRECGGRPPAARPRLREWLRFRVVPLEPDHRRLVIKAIALALQPSIEEARDLVELVEVRARVGVVRPAVDPVADKRPRRRRAARLHPERRVDVGVAPAADVEDGRLDGVVVGGQRARSPVRSRRSGSGAR